MSATQNPPPPIDFESLLWRTGELLRAGDADRAAVTIQEALQLKPRDSKARSLLGLVYFKIGKQSEARALYRELAAEFPDDAGIHLNLGLVELKVGAWEAAIEALEAALRLDPQNERAKQYLDLARRVRAQAGAAMHALEGTSATPAGPPAPGERPHRTTLTGVKAPHAPLPPSALPLEQPQSVTAFAAARLFRPEQSERTFALSPEGALAVRVQGELYTRVGGVVSSAGAMTFEPARRRQRGVLTDDQFGDGAGAMFVARGTGNLIAVPRGGRFHALALDEDILYVREDALYAFEGALHWENGRAPGGEPLLVQLRGTGCVVVRTRREPFCVKVVPDEILYADASALVGWIGRVVPRALPAEPGAPRILECAGEGVLIYEDTSEAR